MVRLLVRSRGGSDLHWLVVRFRGERLVPTAGRSLSKDSALLLQRRSTRSPLPSCVGPGVAAVGRSPRAGTRARRGGGQTQSGRTQKTTRSPSTGLRASDRHCPHKFRGTANTGQRGLPSWAWLLFPRRLGTSWLHRAPVLSGDERGTPMAVKTPWRAVSSQDTLWAVLLFYMI